MASGSILDWNIYTLMVAVYVLWKMNVKPRQRLYRSYVRWARISMRYQFKSSAVPKHHHEVLDAVRTIPHVCSHKCDISWSTKARPNDKHGSCLSEQRKGMCRETSVAIGETQVVEYKAEFGISWVVRLL